jgi:hypothetical protein
MNRLRPVIDVREIPPAYSQLRSKLPSLRSYISSAPAPDEQSALAYLGQGVLCGLCFDPGMLRDVLQPSRRIDVIGIGPNMLLTDGDWLWPGALLYYVQEYHLRLPQEFIHHAESNQWRIDPSAVTVEELNLDAFYGAP